MNAIAQIQPSRLPIAPAIAKEFEIQPTEWRVLVDQIFPAAKSVESVMMALAYCRKRNLDIFKKPVHIVPMWSSAKKQMVETVWPGIAEIRTTAARTGEYAGIESVEFGPIVERTFSGQTGGHNTDTITKKVRFPEWASVVVYRIVQGQKCAYHAKVFWEETYAAIGKSDVPNDMWAKRPRGQLDKCVEAAALRKAFPEELGNTYAAEEMEGRTIEGSAVDAVAAAQPPAPPKPPVPPSQQITAPKQNEVIDAETGEVIDEREIVRETGESVDALQDTTPFHHERFLADLDEAMATGKDADQIIDIWDGFDVEATLTGDEETLQRAFDMRADRIARLSTINARLATEESWRSRAISLGRQPGDQHGKEA